MDTTNVCARCGTTVSGVWSSLMDPEVVYCWKCWSPAYEKAEKDGEGFAESMRKLLEPIVTSENLTAIVTRALEDATYQIRRELATVRYYMNHDNEAEVDVAMARGEFVEPQTLGDFDIVSCYNCRKSTPTAEIEFVAINRPWCEECLSKVRCQHEWVDATGGVIVSGEVCTKCFAVRATISEEEKQLRKQGATAFNYIYLSDGTRRLLGTNLGNRDAKELECVEKTIIPDSGATLDLKPSEGESITIGEATEKLCATCKGVKMIVRSEDNDCWVPAKPEDTHALQCPECNPY